MRLVRLLISRISVPVEPGQGDPAMAERALRESMWAERSVYAEAANVARLASWEAQWAGLSAADFPLQAGPPQRPKTAPATQAAIEGAPADAARGAVRLVTTDRKKAGAK